MVNGMKNHKKIEICVFAAIHIQVHDLSNRAIVLKLMLFDQINQVSGINPRENEI